MNELDDNARSLLDDMRDQDDPRAGDRERVRAALVASLGPGVFPSTARGSGSGAPPAASPGLVPVAKVLIGLAVVGAIAGGALLVTRHPASAPTSAPPARTPAPKLVVTASAAVPPALPPAPPPPAPAVSAAPARGVASRAVRAPRPVTSAPAVADEVAILTRAYSALGHGDPAKALAELDEHADRFPDGALAEERAAQRVLALCRLGRVEEARADAARFLEKYPASPQAPRVRSSCGGSAP